MSAAPEIMLAGSSSLAALQLVYTWMLTRKNRTGWVLCFIGNAAGIVYDVITVQYGFIVVSLISLALAVKAYRDWGRADG